MVRGREWGVDLMMMADAVDLGTKGVRSRKRMRADTNEIYHSVLYLAGLNGEQEGMESAGASESMANAQAEAINHSF